ncbi:hypothetical protein EJB05_48049 [Eragrostis curvula]|uniref:Bifunctional inhibitor/plant lipid transfer protein/seed storage helical domain-containing protein n=1 Tax=Eragrostis curvula TaxID=38414 RepID=A0A5J9T0W3_9POAL|nr:hypothetical protein EJB05_50527 [Eragrostis curvula]TVU04905.1 hypothetical protein EJB05_48049 [Eragrostis curvula]
MARWLLAAAALAWWCAVSVSAQSPAPPANPLQAKCQEDFAKLTDCMDYATGHTGSPSSTCCADAGATQKSRPECLCYIIQQVHSGRNEVQSLGLRFERLLALPSACKLANANVTLCINLLHLTPSSPDYALFANASKITPSTDTPSGDSTASSGFKLQSGIRGGIAAAVISAVFSSIF